MAKINEIQQQTLRVFDSKVEGLGKEDYRGLLEEMIADLQSRLDCVEEELDAEE